MHKSLTNLFVEGRSKNGNRIDDMKPTINNSPFSSVFKSQMNYKKKQGVDICYNIIIISPYAQNFKNSFIFYRKSKASTYFDYLADYFWLPWQLENLVHWKENQFHSFFSQLLTWSKIRICTGNTFDQGSW